MKREDSSQSRPAMGKAAQHARDWTDIVHARLHLLTNPEQGYRKLILRLVVIVVLLFLLVGITTAWKEGSGRDVLPIEILQRITWICYGLAQITFVLVLVLAGLRLLARNRAKGSVQK